MAQFPPLARSKDFNPAEALDDAIACFRRYGYHGTSLSQLTRRMGIGRASMYATYGDKRSVYLRSLAAYRDCTIGFMVERLDSGEDPAVSVRSLLIDIAERASSEKGRFGCFLANATLDLAHEDDKVRELTRKGFAQVEDAFDRALTRAIDIGQIDRTRDPRALARMLVATIQGIRVIAKANPDPAALLDIVSAACICFDDPPHTEPRTRPITKHTNKP